MISKKTKYALKALTTLGEEYGKNQPILISELAAKDRIPKKFLELILLELKKNGILHSKQGKGGGYRLAKPPEQIKLGMIMRILEGPLSPVPCLSRTAYRKCDDCEDENTCSIRMVMKDLHEATISILDGTSLADMIERSEKLKTSEMYFI